uniref:Homologous recombination OB-fold protein OB-fold domain-containing protein n=1 Tax=Tanacetum cinerariifolium TaxID=118510 RepID=A0A6L2M1Q6_TANCI|nr:hypothetical protein [Tanacetum cinerariifolium]
MVRQKAIMDLALQFDNACMTKDDLRKAYKKCNDIPQESSALIDAFLKKASGKEYDMNLSMALMSTQKYMQKVVEGVSEDDDFKSGVWVSATNYVIATGGTIIGCLGDIKNFLKRGKLDEVVAIVKSCSANDIGDLNVSMKDLSDTIPETIHHKVIGDGGYGKDITVRAAMILATV